MNKHNINVKPVICPESSFTCSGVASVPFLSQSRPFSLFEERPPFSVSFNKDEAEQNVKDCLHYEYSKGRWSFLTVKTQRVNVNIKGPFYTKHIFKIQILSIQSYVKN